MRRRTPEPGGRGVPSFQEAVDGLIPFCKRYLPNNFPVPFAPMHYEWEKIAISESERENLQAHRESGKSTFWAIAYPLYRIGLWLLMMKDPRGRPDVDEGIGIFGVNDDEASARLRAIKKVLETNELYRRDFGPFKPGEEWTEQRMTFDCSRDEKNPNLFASGLLNATPGVRMTAAIVDDSTDPLHVHSKEQRDKQDLAIQEVVEPNLREASPLILVHTQYHNDDLPNRLSKRKEYHSQKWPLVPDPFDENVAKHVVQWPEAWPWSRVEAAMKKPLIFARQYQLRVVQDEDRLIPEPRRYDPKILEYRDSAWRIRGEIVRMAIGVDPASTEGELNRGSRTALVVAAITPKMEKYVVDCVVGRWAPERVLKEIEEAWKKWQAYQVFIEEVNFSKIYGDLLRKRTACPAKASKAQGDKVQRIVGTLNPEMENGKIYFPEEGGGPGMAEIIRELVEFPGDTLDCADALEHLVRNVNESPVFAVSSGKLISNARRQHGTGGNWIAKNYGD